MRSASPVRQGNYPPEYDQVVRRMLTESSPKQQRAMLRRCIARLHQVAASCRPRTITGTIGLLFVGALLGITLFLGFVYFTKNTTLVHLLAGGSVLEFHGVPLHIEKEVDYSFARPPSSPDEFSSVDLANFWRVWHHIENDFVPKPEKNDGGLSAVDTAGGLTHDDLLNGAIKGLTFATEDPYTNFFQPKDALEFEHEVIDGEIQGIGAYLSIDEDDLLEVVKPISGGPADLAGVRAGDIILSVDGVSSSRYNLSEAASVIRGPAGTIVLLELYRSVTKDTFEVSIVRGKVEVPTVETEVRDGVFIITLSTFTRITPKAFRVALEEFVSLANAGGPNRLVLDLRGNMGGILSVSVYIAGLFLPERSTVLYEYSGTENLKVYKTDKPAFVGGVVPKMTVLVDGATASASEILAAALRHYGIADIVGGKTLGKGSVQTVKSVGASNALLKITTAHWLTPGKESIGDEGIVPDVDYSEELEALYKEDQDADISEIALQKAIAHLKSK